MVLKKNQTESSFISKDQVLNEVKGAVKDSDLEVKFIISDKGFFTGAIGPVASNDKSVLYSRALLLSTERDLTIHNMYLCINEECISNESRGPGPLHTTRLGPQLYYFSNLDRLDLKEGDKVHLWAYASEGISDSLVSESVNAKWIDVGVITVESCEAHGYWCFPN
ncbi:MAG TPA: hypothetical protein VNI77_05490 [Nitrososphaera sp.]|nr:hypothetical protein [Nitrososphaera sp.]